MDEWDKRTTDQAIQFVRLGYSDLVNDNSSFRAMNFTTDELPSRLLIPAIREVETHNAFDGNAVADGLSRFSGQLAAAEFGRRGSPILWLLFPSWTHLRENEDHSVRGERISNEEFEALKAGAIQTFVDELHADAWGTHETLDRKLWFWWD